MISPAFDTYGKFARGSLLADYCELLALKGVGPTSAQLAGYIEENEWDLNQLILRSGQQRQDVEPIGAEDAADAIFEFLASRKQVLGAGYPFEFVHGHLTATTGIDRPRNTYLALLAIATVHAYAVQCAVDPKVVFERTVVDAIASRGLRAAPLGQLRRAGGTFEAAVQEACASLGLSSNVEAVARRRHAHDAGVDAIIHVSWGDARAGAFVWIGQATCARSDEWEKKILEPRPPFWAKALSARVPPIAFLAVPHHVEADLMDQLLEGTERPVMDRLRILQVKQATSADEQTLIQAMLATDVETL